jgi:hypothetical protein
MREIPPETIPVAQQLERAQVFELHQALGQIDASERDRIELISKATGQLAATCEWSGNGYQLEIHDVDAPFLLRSNEDLEPLRGASVFHIPVPTAHERMRAAGIEDPHIPAPQQFEHLINYLETLADTTRYRRRSISLG